MKMTFIVLAHVLWITVIAALLLAATKTVIDIVKVAEAHTFKQITKITTK